MTTQPVEGYCMKCKAHIAIKDPVESKLKNGSPAMVGTCPTCNTKVARILPRKKPVPESPAQ